MLHPILDMLRAYFKNETLKLDPTTEKELLVKAKEQALLPYLYFVYNQKEFKSYYVSAAIRQEEFLRMQKELTEWFNVADIKHLYLKGSVLYQLYPDPTLRTRGDIDVFVDPTKMNEAKAILLSKGYSLLKFESQHHLEFIKNDFMVELHYTLFDSYRDLDYFKDPFSLSIQKENCLYTLTEENHFLFCLHHFANHLRKGAGLRYLLDFYYMLKSSTMNMQLLHTLIEHNGYSKLYQNILNAIYVLSEEELDAFPKEDIEFFLEYLVKSGIHGFGEENEMNQKGFGMRNYKFKAVLSGTFLTNKAYRLAKYPRLGKHWFTYPLCLIHRIIYLVCTQTFKLFKLLFSKKNKITKEERDFYNKMGI